MPLPLTTAAPTRRRPKLGVVITIRILSLSVEFVLVTIAVSLFAVSYPADFRHSLWLEGGERGWNSNPRLRIYFYANHRTPPPVPYIWTQALPESQLAVAILSAVVWAARVAMLCFRIDEQVSGRRYVEVVYDGILVWLWAYIVRTQGREDLTDLEHLSLRPWYLEKGCDEVSQGTRGKCRVAATAYNTSLCILFFLCLRLLASALSMAYGCGKRQIRPFENIEPGGYYIKLETGHCDGLAESSLTPMIELRRVSSDNDRIPY